MRTPEKIQVSDHAAQYRVVTEEPHSGPWRHELAPHTVQIMDTYSKPWVRELWFCGVEQSGKTNTMLNCLHWAADVDPGNIFYLMPTEATGDKVTMEKIIPLVRESKRLKKYVGKKENDTTLTRIRLSNGVIIRPAHANSTSSMATFAAKHCFGDEVDKYPEKTGRESDPITLIKKRNRLYRGRYKRFFASTPAGMFIYKGTMACVQVWEYRHKCPECGELFRPEYEGLQFAESLAPEDFDGETELHYSCSGCGLALDEQQRLAAIRAGGWVCIKGEDILRPTRVGFHHRAFDCLDVPLYEIAGAFVASEQGSIADKIDFSHGYEAVDYVHEQKDRDEDFILRLVDEHQPRTIVPEDTYGLLVLADTQRLGFFYQVWAVGFGLRAISVIDHGFVQAFVDLTDIQHKDYQDAAGKSYRPMAGFIDSGGGTNPSRPKHSRTVEVYEFCRSNKFWRPLKGRQTMETPWSVKRLDFYPSSVGKKIPIPGGLLLYTINTTLFKDDLDHRLLLDPSSSGSISFHAELGMDVAKQLTAEYRDERGYWQCPKGKDNHYWDVMVYGLALSEIMGIKNKKKEVKRVAPKQSKGGGFVNNY
jgi:phage terminase large subunit GpA-like protein